MGRTFFPESLPHVSNSLRDIYYRIVVWQQGTWQQGMATPMATRYKKIFFLDTKSLHWLDLTLIPQKIGLQSIR